MHMDLIIEIICRSLGDDYFHETLIKSMTVSPPTETSQTVVVKNTSGEEFKIEVTKL
jgi:hypothetical protein